MPLGPRALSRRPRRLRARRARRARGRRASRSSRGLRGLPPPASVAAVPRSTCCPRTVAAASSRRRGFAQRLMETVRTEARGQAGDAPAPRRRRDWGALLLQAGDRGRGRDPARRRCARRLPAAPAERQGHGGGGPAPRATPVRQRHPGAPRWLGDPPTSRGCPTLARGQVYEAWVQRDGTMEPSSLFEARRDHTASAAIPGRSTAPRPCWSPRSPAAAAPSPPRGRSSGHHSSSAPQVRLSGSPWPSAIATPAGRRTSPAPTAGGRSAPTA